MQGFLNINKPSGLSSAAVVAKIKKQFHLKKVGHMGTLDPLAQGVLVIALGNATRLFDQLLQKTKTYEAVFTFGYETDTLDASGVVVKTSNNIPDKEQIELACRLFLGKQNQLPPAYSAKKIQGHKAYELARENKPFELSPSPVEISEFQVLKQVTATTFLFQITCSSGTYIRSLCRDVAHTLGTVATMTWLTRTKSGIFEIKNAVSLADILLKKDLNYDIINIQDVIFLPQIHLSESEFLHLQNGQSITANSEDGQFLLLYNNQAFGIGLVNNKELKNKIYLYQKEES